MHVIRLRRSQLTTIVIIRSYSLLFASRGANVVVNDFNPSAAQKVVDEITQGSLPATLPKCYGQAWRTDAPRKQLVGRRW